MTVYFSSDEFDNVKKQRDTVLFYLVFFSALYLVFTVVLFVLYSLLPFESKWAILYKAGLYTVTVIVFPLFYVFFGIKYKRVNDYYKMLLGLRDGLRGELVGTFLRYDYTISTKDGVDVKTLYFSVYNKDKKRDYERVVYVPFERDFPDFTEGKTYHVISQANFIIEYEEVLEKKNEA